MLVDVQSLGPHRHVATLPALPGQEPSALGSNR
jgi:hypothetical protein